MRLSSSSHQIIILSCLLLLLSAFTSGGSIPQFIMDFDMKGIICCQNPTTVEPLVQIKSCKKLEEAGNCLKCVMFIDKNNQMRFIDHTAPWLPARIYRLQMNGIQCEEY